MKENNSLKITGIIVSAVLILGLLGFLAFMQIAPGNVVSTNGQATVNVMPDRIIVYFSAETTEETAKEAKDANAVIVDNLVMELLKLGFSRDEIITDNFNVYEEYDWSGNGERKFLGFKATHRISIELGSEDSQIGEVIDAGIDSGALLSYINFGLSTELQNEYKAEALSLATKDARNKAEAIADGLGAKLGRVVSISDNDFGYYPWRVYESGNEEMALDGAKIATSITPGEREITARVSVTYKLN